MKLDPHNLTAQLHHRSLGNPATTLPDTAISNCFPGLEYDFRNLWRRAFEGLVLHESNNLVTACEDSQYAGLVGHRLLKVDEREMVTLVKGPFLPGGPADALNTKASPNGVAFLEWSNSLAYILQRQGHKVTAYFTRGKSDDEVAANAPALEVELTVRKFFAEESIAPAEGLLKPGEMTQGLCSPWQNDYRECACYYWAASRPDFVNVEPGSDGLAHGDNWMSKVRSGEYLPDDRSDKRFIDYDELFLGWQKLLKFQIKGHDAEESDLP